MEQPYINILIPFTSLDHFIIESVQKCLQLNYINYKIVLLPDEHLQLPIQSERIIIIPTGKVNISRKRNIGIDYCVNNCAYIAFIDSDAFPNENWLINSIKYFNDKLIMAVGGPNLTPPNEDLRRTICGYIYAQTIAFGNGAKRHKISNTHFCNELPTCNLIVRASILHAIRFDENYKAAEDSKLCGDIINLGYKILFARDVFVMHHRRRIFISMMIQSYYYGYFRAKLISNLRNLLPKVYFPLLFLLYIVFVTGNTLFLNPGLSNYVLFPLYLYLTICYFSSLRHSLDPLISLITAISIFCCHISYGLGFLNYYINAFFSFIPKLKVNEIN